MASFNEISGIPSTGNHWLMSELLRGEWGFQGFVVSDYTGDEEMIKHGFAKDFRDAAKLALLAGVDMSMQSGIYRQHLPGLVRGGQVPERILDQSVRRVLAMKAMLGLFDDPFRRIDEKRETARAVLPKTRALAREAGRKAIVLLKNDGDLLPLPRSGKLIALIGPFASGQHDLIGPWCVYGDDAKAVDLATGVKTALADKASLIIAQGSGIEEPLAGGIDQAVAAARKADIVVLAIGEGQGMSGEAQSRTEIVVPEPQQQLAQAVAAVGKPLSSCSRTAVRWRSKARSPTRPLFWSPGSSVPRRATRSPMCCSAPTALQAAYRRASPGNRDRSLITTRTRRQAGPIPRDRSNRIRRTSAAFRTVRYTRSATVSPMGRSNTAIWL